MFPSPDDDFGGKVSHDMCGRANRSRSASVSLRIRFAYAQVKLNTDESPNIATEYGIRSIPTVMIFKDGEKVETVIGAVPKTTLVNTIDKYL